MKKISNFKFQILNSRRGFTLIELLVVIAIIGVLSALLMTNFVGIRQRARDGQRKSDLRQIQSALELYRSDTGSYPDTASHTTNGYLNCGPTATLSNGNSVYMKIISCDPLDNGAPPYRYQYTSTDGTYCLRACLENANDSQKDPNPNTVNGCPFLPANNCPAGTTASYTLQNP